MDYIDEKRACVLAGRTSLKKERSNDLASHSAWQRFKERRLGFESCTPRAWLIVLSASSLLTSGTAMASTLTFSDSGTFVTEDAEMFRDPNALILDEDYYAVQSGRAPNIREGTSVEVTNPDRTAWQVAINKCKEVFMVSANTCRDGAFGIPGIGPAPVETLTNGAFLNIRNAEVNLGLNARIELAPGTVDASQNFAVDLHVSQDSFRAGDLVTISTEKTLGQSALRTDLDVIDMSVSSLTDLTYDIFLETYSLDVRTDLTLADVDTGLQKTEILGLSLGDAALELRHLENTNTIQLSDGISYEIPAPIIPPPLNNLLKFPIADVTAYVPDFDVEAVGSPIVPSVYVATEFDDRTSDSPITGDFAKTDLDLDIATVFASRIPMGLQAGVTGLASAQINVLDADLGGYFNLAQEQSFIGDEIDVKLTFSVPVEVEVSPGVFEFVTEFVVRAGGEFNFRHPGGDLEVAKEYILADNKYANRTGFVFAPAFTYKFLNAEFSALAGLYGAEFSVFEDVLEIGDDPIPLGEPVFHDLFALDGFNTVVGSSFQLAADPAPVPLPASGLLLLAATAGFVGLGRRKRMEA